MLALNWSPVWHRNLFPHNYVLVLIRLLLSWRLLILWLKKLGNKVYNYHGLAFSLLSLLQKYFKKCRRLILPCVVKYLLSQDVFTYILDLLTIRRRQCDSAAETGLALPCISFFSVFCFLLIYLLRPLAVDQQTVLSNKSVHFSSWKIGLFSKQQILSHTCKSLLLIFF